MRFFQALYIYDYFNESYSDSRTGNFRERN